MDKTTNMKNMQTGKLHIRLHISRLLALVLPLLSAVEDMEEDDLSSLMLSQSLDFF